MRDDTSTLGMGPVFQAALISKQVLANLGAVTSGIGGTLPR